MKDRLIVDDVELLLPTDLRLERNGEKILPSALSESQIYALTVAFQSLLLTLRDQAKMH